MKCRSFPAVRFRYGLLACPRQVIALSPVTAWGVVYPPFVHQSYTGGASLAPRTGFEPASYPFAEGCSPLSYRGMLVGVQLDVSTTLIYPAADLDRGYTNAVTGAPAHLVALLKEPTKHTMYADGFGSGACSRSRTGFKMARSTNASCAHTRMFRASARISNPPDERRRFGTSCISDPARALLSRLICFPALIRLAVL